MSQHHFAKLAEIPSPRSDDMTGMNHATLDYGDDEKIEVDGFQRIGWRYWLSWVLILGSGGLVGLLFYWKRPWWLKLTSKDCSLEKATSLLVTDSHHEVWVRPVVTERITGGTDGFELGGADGRFHRVDTYRFFKFKKLKYVWSPRSQSGESNYWLSTGFSPLRTLDQAVCSDYHEAEGLSEGASRRRISVYGPNHILVRLKSVPELLIREVLNPFYLFQIFSVCLWFSDEYIYYASCIVLISVVSVTLEVYQLRRNQRQLRDMVHSTDVVTVLRPDSGKETIESTNLAPGDILVIPSHGCTMQCDAVLISGNAIVNESMLTGESVPVTKIPIGHEADVRYHLKENAKNTLFCGTRVLQTRYYAGQEVHAVVIRTGFYTFKGDLVRSIMYPKPVDFEFTKDLMKMLGMLGVLAFCGFVYAAVIMTERGMGLPKIIKRSLDIITIVVPPALPAAMTVGIMLARDRLKKKQIFCISPSTINTCGAVNCVVFDKTGTLTEDGLDFCCARPVKMSEDEKAVIFDSELSEMTFSDPKDPLVQGLASCHSLTILDGELAGEPLDMILFNSTKWIFEEQPVATEETAKFDQLAPPVVRSPHEQAVELGILRQFPFSSNLQRMAVIVRRLLDAKLLLFCKGAPEKIAGLCDPESLPADFHSVLAAYSKHGYRVLAISYKELPSMPYHKLQKVKREEIETKLTFLGLLVMENRLKPETNGAIRVLKEAEIRTTMATGDNILTALCVARECGIVEQGQDMYELEVTHDELRLQLVDTKAGGSSTPSSPSSPPANYAVNGFATTGGRRSYPTYVLAMTGKSYAQLVKYHPDKVDAVVACTAIFARVAPEQKALIVGDLQRLGYVVAMCGDGANDCGALKAAHAGVSLSDSEASIASPFTSRRANIECIPTTIREGRAALVTSFGVFKYMAAYSMTQFLSVSILYWIASNLADFQFLYIDLFLITVLALLYGYTPAAEVLVPRPPPSRVLSAPSIASIAGQVLIVAVFQVFIFLYVRAQPWFVPFTDPGDENNFLAFEVTAVFLMSTYQYVSLVIVYSKSYPYRKSILANKLLTAAIVFLTGVNLWITLSPPGFLANFLKLMDMPMFTRGLIVILGMIHLVASVLFEYWGVDVFMVKRWGERNRHRDPVKGNLDTASDKQYERLLCRLGGGPGWVARVSGQGGVGDAESTVINMEGGPF